MTSSAGILHVVLVDWRADTPDDVPARLTSLVGRFAAEIPGVVRAVEGPSVSPEGLEAGFSWALAVTFADASSRDGYLDHPAHAPVAELIGTWAARLVVFDVADVADVPPSAAPDA